MFFNWECYARLFLDKYIKIFVLDKCKSILEISFLGENKIFFWSLLQLLFLGEYKKKFWIFLLGMLELLFQGNAKKSLDIFISLQKYKHFYRFLFLGKYKKNFKYFIDLAISLHFQLLSYQLQYSPVKFWRKAKLVFFEAEATLNNDF